MIRPGKTLTVFAAVLLGYAAILLALIHPDLQRKSVCRYSVGKVDVRLLTCELDPQPIIPA